MQTGLTLCLPIPAAPSHRSSVVSAFITEVRSSIPCELKRRRYPNHGDQSRSSPPVIIVINFGPRCVVVHFCPIAHILWTRTARTTHPSVASTSPRAAASLSLSPLFSLLVSNHVPDLPPLLLLHGCIDEVVSHHYRIINPEYWSPLALACAPATSYIGMLVSETPDMFYC